MSTTARLVTTVVCLIVKVDFTTKIERRLIYLYLQFLREDLRTKWLNLVKHVRRKRGADSFDVKIQTKEFMCARSISRMNI